MNKPKNPHWGYWNVDWSDPRETADALGESYYSGRWSNRCVTDEDLPDGMHIEESPFALLERGEYFEREDE